MSYLKKKKIRKIAQVLELPVPAMIDCEYKFGSGSEWFKFYSPDLEYRYEIYVCANWMSVEKYKVDDGDCNSLLYIDRKYLDKIKLVKLIELVS